MDKIKHKCLLKDECFEEKTPKNPFLLVELPYQIWPSLCFKDVPHIYHISSYLNHHYVNWCYGKGQTEVNNGPFQVFKKKKSISRKTF